MRRGSIAPRRLLIGITGALSLTLLAAAGVSSPTAHYPEKPIRLIVPFPAGGGADYWGRLVAAKLSDSLGQPVVVDNIPGAGGNRGTAAAATATADGYTLLLGSIGPLAVHQYTYESLPYEPAKSFRPVALLESSPILLVASRSIKAATAQELIEAARSHPGELTYASNGNGSPEQVAGEVFKRRLSLDIRHIPFEGAAPARKAVVANQASLMFDPCKGALPAIHKGLQHPLAVAAPERIEALPDVPTFEEIGVPRYELRIWTGVLAPTGTPREIIDKLNKAVEAILRTPDIQKEIGAEGGRTESTTPAQFASFIDAERRRWSSLVRESGIERVAPRSEAIAN